MLSATDEYRTRVMEQVRKSTERLSRVRNGTSLSNALEQQGFEVKKRFMESRRISNNILNELYEDYTYQQEPVEHEESPELHDLLDFATSSKANNKAIVNNKAAFRFLPELDQKLPKNEADDATKPTPLELLLKKAPTFTQSKSVPRLRGLSLEDNYKKGPSADELNKEVMTRIWREEHESAISKLNQLRAQQKLQAITDLEASEKKRGKNDSQIKNQDLGQSTTSAMIVKSSFKCQTPALEKSVNLADSNRSLDMLKKSGSRQSSSVLRFRRDLTPEALRPNVKRIAQNLKTFRLGQVAEVITIHDIPKVQGKKRENKIEYINNSPKRVQIKFVPGSEVYGDFVQGEIREIPNLINKTVAVSISKTKNSVDYSIGVMRENMKFLVKERDITQQKLTVRSKDDSGNMTDLRMDDNKLYRKWPLASNSHSLNDSVQQGSDYVEKPQPSHTSLGETTYLIKKYENYNSRTNEKLPTNEEKSKFERVGHPIEIVSNVSHNMSSLSRGVTSINSSQNDLRPKFQRSMSQMSQI